MRKACLTTLNANLTGKTSPEGLAYLSVGKKPSNVR